MPTKHSTRNTGASDGHCTLDCLYLHNLREQRIELRMINRKLYREVRRLEQVRKNLIEENHKYMEKYGFID